MSKNNFKISCWIFVLFQIGWKINFVKGNYQSKTSQLPTNFKSTEISSDKNNFLDENAKVLNDSFSQLKIITEEDYNKLTEIVVFNLNQILEGIKTLDQNTDYVKDTAKKNYNVLNSVLRRIFTIIDDVKNSSELTCNDIYSSKGGETTCIYYSKTISSIVKALLHLNISQHKYEMSNINKCFKDLPKTMKEHTYFLTPKLKQEAAVKYCEDQGGKPFIPKTQDEFIYYVAMTVEPETDKLSWYPINDIKEEGHIVLQDGTDYDKASYKLQKWNSKWKNSMEADCVTVDIFGEGSWTRCYHYDFVLLCQGK